MSSQVRQVKEATDIVEVIGQRISLQRSGANFKGLCPFHSEKSPSFFVSEQMQRYKCFGCSENGDVFEFLQKYEGMTFYEALKMLADQAGITLEQYSKSPDDNKREQLLQVLDLTREYYHYLLTDHEVGQSARVYLKDRGIHQDSIRLFKLGFSLDSWDGLINYLHKKKKFPLSLLEDAGLIIKGKNSRYYDRFRGRLMFPLTNHRGQVVGFSGRVLDKSVKDAKYINTPETLLYHKSELLFGLSQLYQFIRKKRQVVVVEGEFDVISSSQVNVNNVVAIKGSALTEDHAKLLRRTVDKVLLALDTDSAGIEATKKAIKTLESTQMELRVVQIPNGKDPDELARTNPKLWVEAVKQSVSAYEFLIQASLGKNDPSTPEGKRAIMQELGPILAGMKHAVEQEHYIRELASALNVQADIVKQDVGRSQKQLEVLGEGRESGVESSDQGGQRGKNSKISSRLEKLEKFVLFLLLQSPGEKFASRARELSKIALTTVGASQVVSAIEKLGEVASLEQLRQTLPDDLQQKVFAWYADDQFVDDVEKLDIDSEWKRSIKELQGESLKFRRQEIARRLSEIDQKLKKSDAEIAEQDKLLKELAQINSSVRL